MRKGFGALVMAALEVSLVAACTSRPHQTAPASEASTASTATAPSGSSGPVPDSRLETADARLTIPRPTDPVHPTLNVFIAYPVGIGTFPLVV